MAVARPEVEDEFDEDEFAEEFGGAGASEPWHNSTRAVVGASAVGVAVIAVLVAAIMFVSGRDDSTNAPVDFVDPSFSATAPETPTSSPTTTATITSTTPPSTTEINGPPTPPTTSASSGTSSTSSESPPVPRQRGEEGGPTIRTPRRPRTNVTRTLLPRPIG